MTNNNNCTGCNAIGVNSILGGQQSIKYNNGDLIATQGPNVFERLIISDLRVPYQQVLKGRILLKPGQQNYLLNHLSLGDNATFLTLYAKYDASSRNEVNNYLSYHFVNDIYREYYMSQILTLSGNSTHRIEQMYITNPNMTYSVTLDVLVAVIDNETSFFAGVTGPSLTNAIQFLDQRFSATNGFSIQTYIVNGVDAFGQWQTLAILDVNDAIIAFIDIEDINSLQLSGKIVIVDDASAGVIYLQFDDLYDATQAYSAINYILENRMETIPLSPTSSNFDDTPPLVTFTQYIDLDGTSFGSGITYSSTYSNTFLAATVSLASYSSIITPDDLGTYTIYNIVDNRDGTMSFTGSYLTIYDLTDTAISTITTVGSYSLSYFIEDLASNPTGSNISFTIELPVV